MPDVVECVEFALDSGVTAELQVAQLAIYYLTSRTQPKPGDLQALHRGDLSWDERLALVMDGEREHARHG